jgi:hypothetical protein
MTHHETQAFFHNERPTTTMVRLFGRLYVVLLLLQSTVDASKNLEDLEYRVYPRRTLEEASKFTKMKH